MKSTAFGRFRLTLIVLTLVPLAVSGLVILTPLGSAAVPGVLTTGLAATVLGAGLVAWITQRLTVLTTACQRVADGNPVDDRLVTSQDELGATVRLLQEVEGRRRATLAAYRNTLAEVTTAVARLSEGTALSSLTAEPQCAEEIATLAAAFTEASRKLNNIRQRLTATARVLQELPAAVAAIDDKGIVRYVNRLGEQLLGGSSTSCLKKEFYSLLADPTEQEDTLGRQLLTRDGATNWFRNGARGEPAIEVPRADGTRARLALAGRRFFAGNQEITYVVLRDLADDYNRAATDRSLTREDTLRSVWGSLALAGSEAVAGVQAATRLLASEAKQSSSRDTMLPRVAAVRQQAGELEAQFRTLSWLHQAFWGQLPQPMAWEFQAVEPVREALEQLEPKLKARNVAVTLSDRGGWICGDDQWIRTTLLGILLHAAESAREGTLGVKLYRHTPNVPGAQEQVVFEVVDAGPELTEAQRAALTSPFGGLNAPSYLEPEPTGFLPGLVLAGELARHMGGNLELGTTPAGGLVARLSLPSRVTLGLSSDTVNSSPETGPVEELVMGWRMAAA